jgi:ATP-dependent DNA helicase RecG
MNPRDAISGSSSRCQRLDHAFLSQKLAGAKSYRRIAAYLAKPFETLRPEEANLKQGERGGTGRGTYWMLAPDVFRRLRETGAPERGRRIDWEAAKTRILSVLRQRAERGDEGLSNEEIRRIAHLDRNQAGRLMRELRAEVPEIQLLGAKKGSRYVYQR